MFSGEMFHLEPHDLCLMWYGVMYSISRASPAGIFGTVPGLPGMRVPWIMHAREIGFNPASTLDIESTDAVKSCKPGSLPIMIPVDDDADVGADADAKKRESSCLLLIFWLADKSIRILGLLRIADEMDTSARKNLTHAIYVDV